MAELADAADSKSAVREDVWVRLPPSAPYDFKIGTGQKILAVPILLLFFSARILYLPHNQNIVTQCIRFIANKKEALSWQIIKYG